MKILLLVLCALPAAVSAQQQFILRQNDVAVFGGMGIAVISASDLVEYVNATSIPSHRVDDFGTAISFFGGIEFPVADGWGVKVEHSYLFKSYNFIGTNGAMYDLLAEVHAPSALLQRVFTGKGYFIKVGAGGGYHFGSIVQKTSTFGIETKYTAEGVGMKAEIVGQTAFDENFYGYIGGEFGWEFLGKVKDGAGGQLTNTLRKQDASLNYFFAGLRFGAMYYF
ncbi:MAG: hypothetical protein ACYC09_00525 [Bacteroidota bacterium]